MQEQHSSSLKTLVPIMVILLFTSNFTFAITLEQSPMLSQTTDDLPIIKLEEKFAINRNHPYFKIFHTIKEKDGVGGRNYIKGIYYTNLS